jgi:DNA-binding Lrp family transcriptional regulator
MTTRSTNDTEVPKCKNCTLEEFAILQILKNDPSVTQNELAKAIGKSERTIKARTVEMQKKGLLQRENGKRNGRWEVLIEVE